jgi:ubiquinone biosynthesis protein COQ4
MRDMTTGSHTLEFEIGPRRSRAKRDWRRAVRALRELLEYPDRTWLAFEIVEALDPDHHERALAQLLAHPEGRRIYAERPSLQAVLSDREALKQMPEGSLGRAYLEHIERYGLDAGKLVELGRETVIAPADPDVRWMSERSQMTHDLWHVLSGYGADQLGESTLLLFSLAQTGGRANSILAFGANLRVLRERGLRWIPYAWKAWHRGRRATWLQALPYEKLLPLPLEEVRRAAGLEDPEQAHVGGVVRGDPIPGDA